MLKNKKAIYLLIPLNIVIWGFFIFRIYKGFTDSEDVVTNATVLPANLKIASDSIDYKLSLNYKDPFLKDASKTQNHSNLSRDTQKEMPLKKNELKIRVNATTVAPKPILEIKYLGLIKNSSNGNSTALVSLNGQTKLVKVNEVAEGYTIKSFDNNELVAYHGKEKYIIKK